jgi:hypothetical protein
MALYLSLRSPHYMSTVALTANHYGGERRVRSPRKQSTARLNGLIRKWSCIVWAAHLDPHPTTIGLMVTQGAHTLALLLALLANPKGA